MEPYDAWQEYAAHYDEYHTAPNKPEPRPGIGRTDQYSEEEVKRIQEMKGAGFWFGHNFFGLGRVPNPAPLVSGRTDQYADAPIDVPRLVKIAHAHLALAIQGCQSDSKLDRVADRRVLQEALWGLESLISIWSLDSGK